MLIKTPTELIKRLNELRQQSPRAYAHLKTFEPEYQGDNDDSDTQPLPGSQKDD